MFRSSSFLLLFLPHFHHRHDFWHAPQCRKVGDNIILFLKNTLLGMNKLPIYLPQAPPLFEGCGHGANWHGASQNSFALSLEMPRWANKWPVRDSGGSRPPTLHSQPQQLRTAGTINGSHWDQWGLQRRSQMVGTKSRELEHRFWFAHVSSFSTHIEPSTASHKNPASPNIPNANTCIPNASLRLTTRFLETPPAQSF